MLIDDVCEVRFGCFIGEALAAVQMHAFFWKEVPVTKLYVRFVPLADIRALPSDVRFVPIAKPHLARPRSLIPLRTADSRALVPTK
jgi:hypothetical protein